MKALLSIVLLTCCAVLTVAFRHFSQAETSAQQQGLFSDAMTVTVSDAGSTTTVQTTFTTTSTTGDESCADNYVHLLDAPAQLAGPVQKQGVVPLEYWYPKYLPALTDNILINHNYKFIFIKNTKTAGTTLFKFFGMYCFEPGPGEKKASCLERMTLDRAPTDEAAVKMWQDYFVFTVARNPYNRAGSAYDYMLGRRTVPRAGICADPAFVEFCKDPTIVGRQNMVMKCLSDELHDFYHVEPISRCVMSKEGLNALDFVIRYEHLEADFMQAVGIINQRRAPNLPEITGTLGWDQKGPLTDGSVSTASLHAGKFERCGSQCVSNVASYYKDEVKLFGYPTCVKAA